VVLNIGLLTLLIWNPQSATLKCRDGLLKPGTDSGRCFVVDTYPSFDRSDVLMGGVVMNIGMAGVVTVTALVTMKRSATEPG
jgi:hypothetical protein